LQQENTKVDSSTEKADINSASSTKKGVFGIFETILRRFQTLSFILFLLPIALAYIICLGVSLTPGIMLFQWVSEQTAQTPFIMKAFCYGFTFAIGAVSFALTLIFVVPVLNLPCLPFVKAYRGAWFSLESMPWYYHNALTYLVRYTVLDLLTPSPLNILFFKMMGMKIGKGVLLNTSNISDPCLIVIEDYVTVGGSAFMMAHYGMKGFLIIDKLHIKRGAMIGLSAKLLGGVIVGEKAVVAPNCAVLPKTFIKDGEKYGLAVGGAANGLSSGAA
jgi:hypothetical protein